jgi:hypothetical protein
VELLARLDTPWSVWIIAIGAGIFLVGAAFEARKVAAVRAQVEAARAAARGWLADFT